jgi:hypothetical protein
MREATGGTLLLQLVIIILSVFVFFIAGVMQYSRVYRIKGTIVEAIERGEGGISTKDELEIVFAQAGYAGPYQFCKVSDKRGTYYTVVIYAEFALLPNVASVKVPIRGETRTIDTGVFYDSDQAELFLGATTDEFSKCIRNG